MKDKEQSMRCMRIAVVVSLMLGGAIPSWAKPLTVFILAGQSNMQGHANISTLDSMADDPKTAPIGKVFADAILSPYTTGICVTRSRNWHFGPSDAVVAHESASVPR
jgi:hypothetical protein